MPAYRNASVRLGKMVRSETWDVICEEIRERVLANENRSGGMYTCGPYDGPVHPTG